MLKRLWILLDKLSAPPLMHTQITLLVFKHTHANTSYIHMCTTTLFVFWFWRNPFLMERDFWNSAVCVCLPAFGLEMSFFWFYRIKRSKNAFCIASIMNEHDIRMTERHIHAHPHPYCRHVLINKSTVRGKTLLPLIEVKGESSDIVTLEERW